MLKVHYMNQLEYKVKSRIAIDLYDMNGDLGRIDGSMGFSIESPCLKFTARKSATISLKNAGILREELRAEIEQELKRVQKLYQLSGITIDFHEVIPLHSGLGSKTATLLSTAHAYGLVYGTVFDFREIGVFLGRGGTSGLGINLIDKGGFIVDGGHSTREKALFAPSSAVKGLSAPTVLARYEMPDWKMLLIIPDLPRVSGVKEREFFRRICPVPSDDVACLARITLSQVLPGVAEKDLSAFCEGINAVQNSRWKSSEISIYGSEISELLTSLRQQGVLCAGMSSIGPAVYAFGGDIGRIAADLYRRYSFVTITRPSNTGLIIGS